MTHSESKTSKSPPQNEDSAARAEGPDGHRLFNRELSWVEFNRRVLDMATDESLPLLERLKFLSIFSTNLDEFFMIRVSGLKEQIAEGISELSPDGMTASEQLTEIYKRLRPMLKRQVSYLHDGVLPQLKAEGITIEPYASLNAKEKKKLDKYFHNNLFPILTPQSVDSSHPFPYISNLSLNLGLYIEPDRTVTQPNLKHLYRQKRWTRIKLPPSVPRLIPISDTTPRYALLEEVVAANVGELFPNMQTSKAFVFRVTRDADIELREDEAGDILRTLERELQRRRDRFAVRLEVDAAMPEKMVRLLMEGTQLDLNDIERVNGFINIPDLMKLYDLDRPRLKERPVIPIVPTWARKEEGIFATLHKRDLLVHHPYVSFGTVTDLVSEAADDPDVQAIKICLYRTGPASPVVRSLMKASRAGKQVTAVVELKARFDEENNIEWAKRLESEGVHVIYGISGLKTHSKVLLIVREEKGKLVRYVHIASGNYNPITARVYTDLGLMTANDEIGEDASSLFNFLTGYSQPDNYQRLIVAPLNVRERLISLIKREVKHKRAGREAKIIIKINSLTDALTIEEFYKASQAGVDIDLIVRGICSLRPGIKGLSENIRVRSLVGRFLEHSRIYYFANGGGGDDEMYMGSSDLMPRSFDRRVEVITPVLDRDIAEYLRDIVLATYLRDEVNAYTLRSDGTYQKVGPRGKRGFDAQEYFIGRQPQT